MRLVTVSAHYPPNFVSGGTLQPQRLARGLRARGHDVSVFAGWLGDRPALQEWDEVDETGMPVHWIASGPWIGWSDERNWNNPPVAAAFAHHLDRHRPDVVHFHAMQSLGAGLLPVAREAGARVVVTMHDFWWLCTRQFLVDTSYRPCSLVQAAGVCPCEVDVAWRDRRAASLATLLRAADLVLAPSASAARVLVANGVAGGRVEVDENGLPPEALLPMGAVARGAATATGADRPLRVLYAGGPNEMKGVAVLLDAVELMGRRDGWVLDAYGIDEYLTRAGRTPTSGVVRVLPPFDPEALGEVLAAHDLLVLPSVMRETHSLLTREALAAGLPVVCTDTLGPEEVVVHGVNGLVVPAADPAALAATLDELVGDRGLVERLTEGARRPTPSRTLDEQVEGLERRFEDLVAGGTDPGVADGDGARGPVRHVLFVCGIEGAPLRYRARLPAEALAMSGVESTVRHYRDPELLALAGRADAVVLYRVPATFQVLDLLAAVRATGCPVLFDVDDLIFDPDLRDEIPALSLLPADEAELWMQGVARYRTTMEACDAFIGSTELLVEHARTVTGLPSFRFDNGVGLLLARRADAALSRPRQPGPARIGYFSGTTTHDDDWFHVEPAVGEVLDRFPETQLWLGGHLPNSPALERFGARVRRLDFVDWRELPSLLRDVDVNLAPLVPGSRFNEAKSAIKWLESALCATPTVASPTGPFREAIEHGRTGLLASTHQEWVDAIGHLVGDSASRELMGGLARREALLRWAPALQARRYIEILEAVGRRSAAKRASRSGWEPVALDEPPIPGVTLEPYEDLAADGAPEPTAPSAAPGGVTARLTRLGLLTDRVIAAVRAEGVLPVLRRVPGRLRARTECRLRARTERRLRARTERRGARH